MKSILSALAAAVVLAACNSTAYASPVVVGHRGANTSSVAEETSAAYRYAHTNAAQVLEGDVWWTRPSSSYPNGAMILNHDATLDRTTNCTGKVRDWYVSSIMDRCRTDVGGQRLLKLSELINYRASVGGTLSLEIKPTWISDSQARQFYNMVKASPVRLTAYQAAIGPLNKIKNLDAADTDHRLQYSLIAYTDYPTPAEAKAVGNYIELNKGASQSLVDSYEAAGLRVCLWAAKTATDYELILSKGVYCIVVDDAGKYAAWLAAR